VIKPDNSFDVQGSNADSASSTCSLERDVYEDRTKLLKIGLERMWKKLDPLMLSVLLKRYPFDPNAPMTLQRKRLNGGRFLPERDVPAN
jgi:hypothetical protein